MPTVEEVENLKAAVASLGTQIARDEGTLRQLKKSVLVTENSTGLAKRVAALRAEIARLEKQYDDKYAEYENAYSVSVGTPKPAGGGRG